MKKFAYKNLDDKDVVNFYSVAESIVTDIKKIYFDKNVCQAEVDLISSQKDASPTLSKLRKCISPSLIKDSLEVVLLRTIITNIVAKGYTSLQLA